MTPTAAPHIPAGSVLALRSGEWRAPDGQPGTEPVVIRVVAVDSHTVGGLVAAHGHECNRYRAECGREHCWEGRIVVSAIHRQRDGGR